MSEQNLNDMLSGGGLASLLQNPEVMAKLPKIMEALSPMMAEMQNESAKLQSEADKKEGGEHREKKQNTNAVRRRALLRALEPYLSDNRREAMDYISKVLTVVDILSEVM